MEINLDAMFLGNLSSDSVASSLLKTINSNHNLQKKKAATPCNTWTQQTNSSTEKGSLWDYSDIFGQEWEQGAQ